MSFKVVAGVSARHIHLSRADMDVLFGKGSELTVKKTVGQPGQFAANEQVVLKTEKGEMKLRVLGPLRKETQVEMSFTDGRSLKINPPLRNSGDLKGSLGGLLIGPKGQVEIKEGIIVAARHVHLSPETAAKNGLKDGDMVDIKTFGPRSITMNGCLVRSGSTHADEVHIDTDEANASSVASDDMVEIITK